MKRRHNFLLLLATAFMACASPEERSTEQIDTNTIKSQDTAGTDTVTSVNGRSGDNGTGTDTTNTAEQRAIHESGN